MRVLQGVLVGAMLLSGGLGVRGAAQDFKGAGAVLKLFSEQEEARKSGMATPAAAFRRELGAFAEKSGTLPPKQAAEQWLKLADRALELAASPDPADAASGSGLQFSEVMAAIPPPATWNALSDQIRARQPVGPPRTFRDGCWRFLADALMGNGDALWEDLLALRNLLAAAPPAEKAAQTGVVVALNDVLLVRSTDPARILAGLEMRLALQDGANGDHAFDVPDLVTQVGAESAEKFLRRLLTTSRRPIRVSTGDSTRALARKVALQEIARLKSPPWSLCHTLDSGALFQALSKRFPAGKTPVAEPHQSSDSLQRDYVEARTWYTFGLIVAGRAQEAAAKLLGNVEVLERGGTYGQVHLLEQLGHGRELREVLILVLKSRPDVSMWDDYVRLSAQLNQLPDAINFMRAQLASPRASATVRQRVQPELARALLAADRLDEGVTELRKILAGKKGDDGRPEAAKQLVRLGHIVHRAEWIEEGLKALGSETAGSQYAVKERAQLLQEIGRIAEAEKLLLDALRSSVAQERSRGAGGNSDVPTYLVELAGIYHRAGRKADVLMLLDQAPGWGAGDLRDLLETADQRDTCLAFMAAEALVAAKRPAEAISLAEALVQVRGDYDPAYELLANLQGVKLLPLLERLADRDRFEERPLIWKAYVLFKAGRWEEAEQAARAAISIDPSDGEMKHGRRMRVYAVLADILEARGDAGTAKVFRGAVQAIRVSEGADKLWEAGLLDRALKQYTQALTHFADAYCIQSRLAVQLANQGRMQEAEQHYRRAYELMPDSFGRMESHCFGCEGVFQGKRASQIAEQVFTELVARTPKKPQVHYLLGYLREQQERYSEALRHYRDALALDPDYLNAWKHLQSVGARIRLPLADRDAVALAMLRLDPLLRHIDPQVATVTDLKGLWHATEAARRQQAEVRSQPLYRLKASAEVIEKQDAGNPQAEEQRRLWQWHAAIRFGRSYSYGRSRREVPTPGEQIAGHPLISTVAEALQGGRQNRGLF